MKRRTLFALVCVASLASVSSIEPVPTREQLVAAQSQEPPQEEVCYFPWWPFQYIRGRMWRGGALAVTRPALPIPTGEPGYSGPWEAVPGGWILRGGAEG